MLRSFGDEESGAVAIIFALLLIPILIVASAAIDYSRLTTERTKLQAAVDAAVLAGSPAARSALANGDTSAFALEASQVIQAQLSEAGASFSVDLQVTLEKSGVYCIKASRDVELFFASAIGVSTSQIGAKSCAAAPTAVEVALALDNSGSMDKPLGAITKLQALVLAATDLVDAVAPAGSTDAAISVTPFAATVNVGAQRRGATWLDMSGASSTHWSQYVRPLNATWLPTSRFDLFDSMGTPWKGCVEERPAPYLTTDVRPTPSIPDSLFVPYLAPDDVGPATGGNVAPDGSISYNSYLADDGGVCAPGDADATADAADPISQGSGAAKICKYRNQQVAAVDSLVGGKYGGGALAAGPNLGCIETPLQLLTSAAQTDVKGAGGILARMIPEGDTNLLSGFMWAWRTLSPNGPFADVGATTGVGLRRPKPYDESMVKKVIVMMTDGVNNWVPRQSPYGSMYTGLGFYSDNRLQGSSSPTTSTNARQQLDQSFLEACDRAKSAGVKVYTVAFSTPDTPMDADGAATLAKCASNAKMALSAGDADSLRTAFQQIGADIKRLRLVR
jgi:Flp pilus assembly protein TadG